MATTARDEASGATRRTRRATCRRVMHVGWQGGMGWGTRAGRLEACGARSRGGVLRFLCGLCASVVQGAGYAVTLMQVPGIDYIRMASGRHRVGHCDTCVPVATIPQRSVQPTQARAPQEEWSRRCARTRKGWDDEAT